MASLFSAKERYLFNSNQTSSDQSWKTSPKPVIQGFNNVPGYRNGNSFGQDLNLDYPNGVVTSTLAYSEPQNHLSYGEALRSASPVPISKSGRSSKISVLSDLNPPLRRAQSHPRMGVSNNNSMNMNGEGHHSLGRAYPTGSYSHHSLARTEQSVGLGDKTWKGTSSCIAFLLLTSSLFLIGTGSGLMGFYRIHYLDMVAVEFLLVPLLMVIGGLITMLNAIFGFYINVKETSCLMITYAVILIIHLFPGEYTCCGAYNFNQGYLAWKQTVLGADRNSVPDSCCLHESAHCGQGIFDLTDQRLVMQTIHVHGCLTIMQVRLKAHVIVIMYVFAVIGSLIAIVELLAVVLAFCMATQYSRREQDDNNWDYDYNPNVGRRTPNTLVPGDYSSQHETSF
ncbi:hypothetical protein TCAL_04752 [Tigriopus californicus]|uniref:Tetraspanin n=1 Tax=Tigriopus californicus TaxID=6832 RepID=A0A553P263_TIGCA|nr:hypothetical protein TCAL_04752 [Tigriopus californicus]